MSGSNRLGRLAAVALLLGALTALPAAATKRGDAKRQLASMSIEPSGDRLVQYAADGDLVTVGLLLDVGVSARAVDSVHGATALHNAAAQGHLRLIARLLEEGADINALDSYGATPLINAAYNGRAAAVDALLAAKAKVNLRSGQGSTALVAAVLGGDLKIVDKLLVAGADPAQLDGAGSSARQLAEAAGRSAIVARLDAAGSAP